MIDNLQAMIAALRGQGPQGGSAPVPNIPYDNNTMIPGMNSFGPMPSDFIHRVSGQAPIDNSIDISQEGEGPYSLGQFMYDKAHENDLAEKQAGTRFHDSGLTIPGRQKGLNDQYMDHPALIKMLLKP